jgi:hypothetical protein
MAESLCSADEQAVPRADSKSAPGALAEAVSMG